MNISGNAENIINKLLSTIDQNAENPFEFDFSALNCKESEGEAKELLELIKKYNIYDFIAKLSALNIVPENQNKCIVFDYIINMILCEDSEDFCSENRMSNNMFQNIINKSMSLPISSGIDPIESPFIYRISFHGNFRIFTGIDRNLGYNLQHFLNVLFLNNSTLADNKEFIDRCRLMSTFILDISENIANTINYDITDLTHYEQSNITFPNSCKMKQMLSSIIITNEIIDSYLPLKEQDVIFSTFKTTNLDYSRDNYSFFYAPFIRNTNNDAIILNPAMLGSFLINYILVLANEYGIYNELVNAYNDEMWKNCMRHLIDLGHFPIDLDKYDLTNIDTDYFKDSLLSACDRRLIWVRFFCDNGDNFNRYDMYETCFINKSEESERWTKIKNEFSLIPLEHIYFITIICSFSRGMMNLSNEVPYERDITITPFELKCISINEKNHNLFIPRYIESKMNVNFMNLPFNMELDQISQYTANDYSFYFSDNVDVRTANCFTGFGDAIDYINKALIEENSMLVHYPGCIYLKQIYIIDKKRNIYKTRNLKKLLERVVIIQDLKIWVTAPVNSDDSKMILSTLTDFISYWIAELKDVFICRNINFSDYVIQISLSDEIQKYYDRDLLHSEINISENLSIMVQNNKLFLKIGAKPVASLSEKSNHFEKQLMEIILASILNLSDLDPQSEKILNSKFSNPLKKKVFCIDPLDKPYLKPIHNGLFRIVPVECTEKLLDELGDYLKEIKKIPLGKINDDNKVNLCNDIVDYLFNKLTNDIKCYNCTYIAKRLCFDLEVIMYAMMLKQMRYSYDIACYPEKIEIIDKEFFNINKSSLAMKFLLEYIAAEPHKGKKIIDEMEYEYLLAICSLIIDWSQKSDLYQYKIINSEMIMLDSNRIGMDKTAEKALNRINTSASVKKLRVNSNPYIEKYYPEKILSIVPDELDTAFIDEFGYSFTNLTNTVYDLVALSEESEQGLRGIEADTLIDQVSNDTEISPEITRRIIYDLSLKERESYLKPPKGYTKNDIWPWKFNRRLSFTRRPLIDIDGIIYYGQRQLYHSLMYIINLISNGKFHAKDDGKLKVVLGKIADKRGNEFNDLVAYRIKGLKNVLCDSKVKKINGKRIASHDKKDIGDIDVLIILPKMKKIIVSEVKDFSFSKNPYEIQQEYKKVFSDEDGKLGYLSKHKRRVEWVKQHIDDVIKHYRLQESKKWKVIDTMILDEALLSNEYFNKQQNVILFSDLSTEILEKL